MKNRQLTVGLGLRSYQITIGRSPFSDGSLEYPELTKAKRFIVITNDTVGPLYFDRVARSLATGEKTIEKVTITDGEAYKTQETLWFIYDQLLAKRVDRSTVIVALGGGVVGDVAGFAAATFQRGIPFVQIPTTLLAQVDSSVGGKTAINHPAGKNMIGAFYQPKAVIIDLETLETLPSSEFRAGMAEVIKYGAIMDGDFFTWIEKNIEALMRQDHEALGYAIETCCHCKARIVEEDERESGVRAILNFGHTFGHAIESGLGYGQWLHGEAVAAGMLMAGRLSELQGQITPGKLARLRDLLARVGLPLKAPNLGVDRYLELMGYDKKVLDGKIRLVLLRDLGDAYVSDTFDQKFLEQVLHETEK